MVSLLPAREKGNHKGICLHYISRRGAPSELINFPDYITCILKAHRNLECNDFVPNSMIGRLSGHVRPRQGTEICNFGAPSPLDFFRFSPVDFFPFSPGLLCNLVRKWPQNVEKIARFPGGEKGAESCHACACHGFFGPETGGLHDGHEWWKCRVGPRAHPLRPLCLCLFS